MEEVNVLVHQSMHYQQTVGSVVECGKTLECFGRVWEVLEVFWKCGEGFGGVGKVLEACGKFVKMKKT